MENDKWQWGIGSLTFNDYQNGGPQLTFYDPRSLYEGHLCTFFVYCNNGDHLELKWGEATPSVFVRTTSSILPPLYPTPAPNYTPDFASSWLVMRF